MINVNRWTVVTQNTVPSIFEKKNEAINPDIVMIVNSLTHLLLFLLIYSSF